MSKIKVSELFYSIQGEGRHAGVPSIFLRTFGCNLRCPGFGRDHGITGPNADVAAIIQTIPQLKAEGKTFNDLPLVATGCDTYAATYPEFKDFSPMMTSEEIAKRIKGLIGEKKLGPDLHLVITGGEPLLPGWQKAYVDLVERLGEYTEDGGDVFVTFETNGTQELDEKVFNELYAATNVHFSVSPKLKASGEKREDTFHPHIIASYAEYGMVDLKFVVDTEETVLEVLDVVRLIQEDFGVWAYDHVYLMPVGGTLDSYKLNAPQVAQLAMKHGLRYSPRLQNDLWGNGWGT